MPALGENGVVTPDGVLIELPLVDLGRRAAARLIDLVVIVSGVTALSVPLSLAELGTASTVVLLAVAGVSALIGYPLVMEATRGRTVGHQALGLRVVTVEGGPVGVRHAAARAMVGVPELFASLGLIGSVSVLISSRRQRLGDLVAGTLVVSAPPVSAQTAPLRFEPPTGRAGFADSVDGSRLGSQWYDLVRDYMIRATAMAPVARAELADRLADAVEVRLGSPRPQAMEPDVYLVCALAAHQRVHRAPVSIGSL